MTDRLPAPPRLSLNDVALFFDVDGTLVAIEQQPEDVKVSESLRTLMAGLIDSTDGAVALVSGRSIAQLDELFQPLAFSASGLHGLEQRLLPGPVSHGHAASRSMDGVRAALQDFAGSHPGTRVEDKGLTLALHYRMAAEHREAAAALVKKLVLADPDHLVLLEGKMVFELKPPGVDKGKAIAAFMDKPPFRGRRPIFAGDDVTDEAGFAEINNRGGVAIKVGADDRPTEAAYGLADVKAVLVWLDDLSKSKDAGRPGDQA